VCGFGAVLVEEEWGMWLVGAALQSNVYTDVCTGCVPVFGTGETGEDEAEGTTRCPQEQLKYAVAGLVLPFFPPVVPDRKR
jgi:hypothetical protein